MRLMALALTVGLLPGRALAVPESGIPSGPLTRAEAVELALSAGPDLAAARPLLAQAKAAERIAGELPNPTVGASLGPDDPTLYGTLDQRLPIFGQRGAALRAAEAETHVASAELDLRRLQVRVAVQRAYTALSLAQSEVQLAMEAAATAADLASHLRAKVDARLAPELDAEQAELGSARATQEVDNRRAAVIDRRLVLAQLLGVPPDTELTASELLAVPSNTVAALTLHPQLAAAELDVAAAAARVRREQAAVRPAPTVGLQLERLSPVTGNGSASNSGASLGVRGGFTVDLPVLSQNGGAIERERQGVALAEATLHQVTTRLEAGRRAAQAKLTAAAARAAFDREVLVPGAQRVAALATTAYELGLTPLVSLLQARNELNVARAGAVEAAAQAWDAREDLEEVVGALP